jgi:hypothetical protein
MPVSYMKKLRHNKSYERITCSEKYFAERGDMLLEFLNASEFVMLTQYAGKNTYTVSGKSME